MLRTKSLEIKGGVLLLGLDLQIQSGWLEGLPVPFPEEGAFPSPCLYGADQTPQGEKKKVPV